MARRNVIQFSIEVRDKASKQLQTMQAKFARFGKAVAQNARRIGLGVAAAGVAFIAFVNKTTKAFDALSKFSDLTGATVETLSALEFAAARSGVAVQTLNVGIRGMTRNTSDAARGIGEALEAFQELNISAVDLNKLEFDQQMLVLADAFSKVESGTQRLVLAQDIFGGRAAEILKLFKDGAQGIIDYRAELEKLGGVVTTQAGDISAKYQDSLTNLSAAFDGLKVALVESGIVEALTDFNNAFARFIAQATGNDLANELLLVSGRIVNLKAQIDRIATDDKPGGTRLLKGLRETLQEAEAEYDRLLLKQGELIDRGQNAPTVRGADPLSTTGAKANPLQGFIDSFDTVERQVQKMREKFRDAILAGIEIPEENRQKFIDAINAMYNDGIDEITVTARKKFAENDPFDPLIAAAEQAARNTQDAFAEFFFDPFEDGLKGLVDAFIRAVRRMIAEALALQTVKLFGFTDIFSKILGRASGGPASGLTMVGERGPELVNLPRGSRVVNNSATNAALRGGEPQFITNIDARGADPGLIARLPQYLEQRDKQLMLAVQRYVTTGTLPI